MSRDLNDEHIEGQMEMPVAEDVGWEIVAKGLLEDMGILEQRLELTNFRIDDLLPAETSPEGAIPVSWSACASTEEWDQLADWVDWLVQEYEVVNRIPPCWPLHPGVANDLSAHWLFWVQIHKKASSAEDRIVFHDRWLPSVLARTENALYRCSKTHGHVPLTIEAVPTQRVWEVSNEDAPPELVEVSS